MAFSKLRSNDLRFYKMEGAGNDFIGVDCRGGELPEEKDLRVMIPPLADRHHGIGFDGVILIMDSPADHFDFQMKYLNADGSVGEMCGNGARCAAVLAHRLGVADQTMRFHTDAGDYRAELEYGGARVFFPPVRATPEKLSINQRDFPECWFLPVGVPHAVIPCDNLEAIDVESAGRAIRNDPDFAPQGTNVNFSQWKDDGLYVRTYERGVEAETLACGTGSIAAAICAAAQRGFSKGRESITVIPKSKHALQIEFSPSLGEIDNLVLSGPARIVYIGLLEQGI